MKWSLRIGNIWGTDIRLHASLLLLIPYVILVFKPDNLVSFLLAMLLLVGIFASVALHEIGHALAARQYHIPVASIVLWPLGGYTNLSRRPTQTLANVVISAAGPLVNLLVGAILGMVTATERLLEDSQMLPGIFRLLWWSDIFAFLGMLAVMNLALAVFNLAPVYPLDGGQIAQDVLKSILGERRANLIMMIFSLPAALALCVAGLILKDIATGLTGLILLAASLTLNPWLYNKLFLAGLYLIDRPDYYLRNEDYDQAIRAYSHAIQRHPDRAGAYLSRAVAAMNLLDLPAARVDIDRALALDANNATAWTLWGELLALDKDNPAALAAYNRAIELRPNWSVTYLDRGSCYYEQGDYDRALEEINKGIELGSGSPTGYLLRSQFRYERGDINGSHEDADHALAYAPQWMLVFSEIFLTNLAGHLNWSLDYYWRAIERMPKAYQVYQGRGDACRINHHPDWAIEDYHRAIRLAPRQGELYLARGRAYQELGEPEKAADDFRAAAQLGNRTHIRRQAGEALAQLMPGRLEDHQSA